MSTQIIYQIPPKPEHTVRIQGDDGTTMLVKTRVTGDYHLIHGKQAFVGLVLKTDRPVLYRLLFRSKGGIRWYF